METEVKVGWFAFAGGKFLPDANAYPNCQGVVAWLNPDPNAPVGKRGLILMPDYECLNWTRTKMETEAQDEYEGRNNMHKILCYTKDHGIKFPAMEWCYVYSKNGVKIGEAFLPAKGQWWDIIENLKIINESLVKIGGAVLSGMIWSSTEYASGVAWCMEVDNLYATKEPKTYYFQVRAVVAF